MLIRKTAGYILLSLLLILRAPSLAWANDCLRTQLFAPAFLSEMNLENTDWILETVRTSWDARPEHVAENQFRNYLQNTMAATRHFDEQFRSGQLASNLAAALKAEHKLLVRGESKLFDYIGTTIPLVKSSVPEAVRETAGLFVYEQGAAVSQSTLLLKKASPSHPGLEWTGPGPELVPPPNLPGPFPTEGETWHLWFPEIAEKARRKNLDPHEVMPANFGRRGNIVHRYPRFIHQKLYLERMSELMTELEGCLLRSCSHSRREILHRVADYYQTGINAHLFFRVNNSLLMNQVNYLLHTLGLKGIPHEALDYLALYRIPEDFRAAFIQAVERRNPSGL